jgi:hypothetical protein
MRREMMRIDGIPQETRQRLQEVAQRRFGQANASLLVRHLVTECLAQEDGKAARAGSSSARPTRASVVNLADPTTVRVELRLPKSVVAALDTLAEQRLSTRNYFIGSLIYRELGQAQLQGDEIETLRRSNYELAKIGTNLNQVARAFNLLVKAGGGGKLPEIGKKMAALRSEIKAHTNKVLRVLEAKTVVWEKNAGKRQAKG